MVGTLAIVAPIFGLVALGFAAARSGILGDRVTDGLSDFVFVIAVPALLFRTLAAGRPLEVDPWAFWLAYFVGLAVAWGLAMVAVRRLAADGQRIAPVGGFAAAQANTVFVGIPLVLSAYGEAALTPTFLLLAIHLPITMTVATLMVARAERGGAGGRALLVPLLRHPILIGIGAGVLFRLSGLPLPDVALRVLALLADAAAPVALFALGMSLTRTTLRGERTAVAVVVLLKIGLHPALVWLLAVPVLGLPPVYAGVAVLMAACPSGINAWLLARRHDLGVSLTSGAIALSTLLAPLSTAFWLGVLGLGR